MASYINITVEGFDELEKLLGQEPQNQVEAMVKAQVKLSTQAVEKLKRGLSHYGGRRGLKKGGYETSPKWDMPYRHSGRLLKSIGCKTIAHKRDIQSKIGSGVMANPIEYAKYLEGRNHDGIRPFLWAVKDLVTSERLLAYFDKYWKPLQGKK